MVLVLAGESRWLPAHCPSPVSIGRGGVRGWQWRVGRLAQIRVGSWVQARDPLEEARVRRGVEEARRRRGDCVLGCRAAWPASELLLLRLLHLLLPLCCCCCCCCCCSCCRCCAICVCACA